MARLAWDACSRDHCSCTTYFGACEPGKARSVIAFEVQEVARAARMGDDKVAEIRARVRAAHETEADDPS